MLLPETLRKYQNEYVASIAATLSVFMVVTTNAWSSPALPKLRAEDSPIRITEDEGSWIVAIQALGAGFGPIFTGVAADRIGRKLTCLSTCIPATVGWILIGVGDQVGYLYAARFLFGVSYGVVYSVTPIYLGEITSDAIRGSAGTLITVLAKLGFMAVYCIGPYVAYRTLAWMSMAGPVIFVVCYIWMPESPYYLLGKNKDAKAEKSLSWLRRLKDVSDELQAMKRSVESSKSDRTSIKELFNPANRASLRILLILVFSMQMTGLLAILGYAQTIFEKINTNLKPEEMSIVLGAVQFVAVIFPAVLVDRMGRRPLLLLSTAVTAASLLACSIYFIIEPNATNHGWIAFVTLLLYIVSYGMGLASVSFAVSSEIFPKNIRALANAAFAMFSALVVLGVVKMFQVTLDSVGPQLPFGIFGICGCVGFVLIYFFVPETKGLSLDEIQQVMNRQNKKPA
ncbi:facilitated trehalose transporter Tret1-like [Uranotaenia lowii]|uniref:facilitated trehalose transporter Tret1-like n=1 Tax=Uranotaenia lowii TaxID=190385 RepID=UPI002479E67D|nr:facilitated trehalose transporter Tret1-like [Uranotaenia lowii]